MQLPKPIFSWFLLVILGTLTPVSAEVIHHQLAYQPWVMPAPNPSPIRQEIEVFAKHEIGLPFISDVIASPDDFSENGKLHLGQGWCSARRFPERPDYIATACHCVYGEQGFVESAIFETWDGTRYAASDMWITRPCMDSVGIWPRVQDAALLRIAHTGADHGLIALGEPMINVIISTMGFPSNVFAGGALYEVFSLVTAREFPTTAPIFTYGGDLVGGASGGGILCDRGAPYPGQVRPSNVFCGVLSMFFTQGGVPFKNGGTYLEDHTGPWFADILCEAGVQID